MVGMARWVIRGMTSSVREEGLVYLTGAFSQTQQVLSAVTLLMAQVRHAWGEEIYFSCWVWHYLAEVLLGRGDNLTEKRPVIITAKNKYKFFSENILKPSVM